MGKTAISICVTTLIWGTLAATETPDLDEYARRLAAVALDFEHTLPVEEFDVPLDYGSLRLERGVVIPLRIPDDDRIFEWVFVGQARLRFEAPDDVEAQQLASFTGDDKIDAPVHRAVLIIGDVRLTERLARGASVDVDPGTRAAAEKLFREWTIDVEREGFGVQQALLRAMAGDVDGAGFFGLWFESSSLGRGFYRIDPAKSEPVALGAHQLLDREDLLTRRQKKRAKRSEEWRKKKEEQRARENEALSDDEPADQECGAGLVGLREQWLEESRDTTVEFIDQWVSSVRPGVDPDAPTAKVEPEHYKIEISLFGDDLLAKGMARIRLRAERDGARVLSLMLGSALETCEVLDREGRALPFYRHGWELLVLLPEPTVTGETFDLTVRFAGQPVDHWFGRRKLFHTMHWYPHAGNVDHATYDVTLRWPEALSLLASGQRVEQGSEDGMRWERRTLDVPTMGFSFEVGNFESVEEHIGHIDLTFGFYRQDREMTEEIRAEIRQVAKASILFFETRFGILPIDRMTIVTVARGASQGLLGFITLSENAMHGALPGLLDNRTRQERRLETIAHEVSHQWWGNVVGWDSYRDQWLSEALADFSATQFMAAIAPRPEEYQRRHASMWRQGLKIQTFDGRAVASLGPVVLGTRLIGHHGWSAYHQIVYEKGAAVFSTLSQRLGPEPTLQMLGSLTRSVNNRVISTSTFVRALERMSGQDLQAFAQQYIRGIGMPAMFYDYRYNAAEQGGFVLEGRVLQLPAPNARYVVQRTDTGWDVVRKAVGGVSVADWAIVVPYRVEADGQATRGTLDIQGERSTFSLPLAQRPTDFQLDPLGQILADVQSERFEPKRYLCDIGEHLAKLGRFDEALEVLDQALQTATVVREVDIPEYLEQQTLELNARIRLVRARALLDSGQAVSARVELELVEKMLPKDSDYYQGERTVLVARLELIRGRSALAFAALNDYFSEHGVELETFRQDTLVDSSALSSIKISYGEMLALVAVASHAGGEPDSALLVRVAGLAGVDMRAILGRD